jgi:hypothetical protein
MAGLSMPQPSFGGFGGVLGGSANKASHKSKAAPAKKAEKSGGRGLLAKLFGSKPKPNEIKHSV